MQNAHEMLHRWLRFDQGSFVDVVQLRRLVSVRNLYRPSRYNLPSFIIASCWSMAAVCYSYPPTQFPSVLLMTQSRNRHHYKYGVFFVEGCEAKLGMHLNSIAHQTRITGQRRNIWMTIPALFIFSTFLLSIYIVDRICALE